MKNDDSALVFICRVALIAAVVLWWLYLMAGCTTIKPMALAGQLEVIEINPNGSVHSDQTVPATVVSKDPYDAWVCVSGSTWTGSFTILQK
jgi:hypothetical protein